MGRPDLRFGVRENSFGRAAKTFRGVRLEALERVLERGKPFFRRKRWKTSHLDGSGQKGLPPKQSSYILDCSAMC